MPDIRITDIDKQKKANKPSKVYYIYGSENYLKRQAVENLLSFCVPEDFPDLNYSRIDGSREGVQEVIDAATQYPVMSDRRCVLVEDLPISKLSSKKDDSDMTLLTGCIERLDPSVVLIFWQNDSDTGDRIANASAMISACRKHGSVLKLDTPKTGDMARMLCEKADELGARLATSDAYYLIERCGRDLNALYGEMDKLSIFAGKKPITRDMIELICPTSLETDVFRISRGILRGNATEALTMANRLLTQGTKPVEMFSALCGNFIDLYRAKCAPADRLAETFPSDYGGAKAFRIDNAVRDQGHYSLAQLRRFIDLLFEAELRLKGGKIDAQTCFLQLITRLCMVGSGR